MSSNHPHQQIRYQSFFHGVVCLYQYQKLEPLVMQAWELGPPQRSLTKQFFKAKKSISYPHIVILFPEIFVKNYLIIQQHVEV